MEIKDVLLNYLPEEEANSVYQKIKKLNLNPKNTQEVLEFLKNESLLSEKEIKGKLSDILKFSRASTLKKIKGVLDLCRNIKFYGWISGRGC